MEVKLILKESKEGEPQKSGSSQPSSTWTTCNVSYERQRAEWLPGGDSVPSEMVRISSSAELTELPWVLYTVLRQELVSEPPRRAVRS